VSSRVDCDLGALHELQLGERLGRIYQTGLFVTFTVVITFLIFYGNLHGCALRCSTRYIYSSRLALSVYNSCRRMHQVQGLRKARSGGQLN